MKLKPNCIACNFNAALSAIGELTAEESIMKELIAEVMQIPAMRGLDWDMTGSDLVEQVFGKITIASGNPDPFRKSKQLQNETCLKLYPWLKSLVTESEAPLFTAVNLAILANSIDPMGYQSSKGLEQVISENLQDPLPRDQFMNFQDRLEQARLIIYLGDNCGEIVFDKLFIETMKTYYDIEVVFVVRKVPTLNDATLEEAHLTGIGATVTLIENGIDGPLPGTILSRCSDQLRSLWSSADLVISKGGGNFDTLSEQKNMTTPICYLLMSKCIPYQQYFNVLPNRPILSVPAREEHLTS